MLALAVGLADYKRDKENMDFLQEFLRWLGTFPLWQEGDRLSLEEVGCLPGDVTVRQEGMVTKNSWQDITGAVFRRVRVVMSLRKVGGMPNAQDAAWLLAFQNWVAEESALGRVPTMGFDSLWWAEEGSVSGNAGAATGVASLRIIGEYTVKHT